MPSEELLNAKEHLKSLEAFIDSRAHVGILSARNEQLRQVNEMILFLDPITREHEIEQFKLRGEKRRLEMLLTEFIDAVEELRDRISDLEDEEMVLQGESSGEV
jgi:hypothetical protein